MNISSVSITPPASSSAASIISNAAAPFVSGARSNLDNRASSIVTLSAQAQQLSQGQASSFSGQIQTGQSQTSQNQISQSQASSRTDTVATENVEPQTRETVEAPGIQLLEGESKGGRISTYA